MMNKKKFNLKYMSQPKINSLTPEQEALIPVDREKWMRITFSTEPIDK